MANFWYNEAKKQLVVGGLDWVNDDIRVMLVMNSTSCDTEDDVNTIGGFGTVDEFDGNNYDDVTVHGIALSTQQVNEDAANNRAELDAEDVTWSSLGVGTRPIQGAVIYKWVTDFSSSIPLMWIDTGGFPITPSGADVTIQWNAEGIGQVT